MGRARLLAVLVTTAACLLAAGACKRRAPNAAPPIAWDKHASTARATVETLAVDASGAVAVAGRFHDGTLDLGGGPLTASRTAIEQVGDLWIAKLDASGAHLWSQRFGDGWTCRPHGVAFDPAGNVFVAGTYGGALDLGGGALPKPIERERFVFAASFDPSGKHRWSRMIGEGLYARMAVDAAGNTIVAGPFHALRVGADLVSVDVPSPTEAYRDSIAVVKLDGGGRPVFASRFGYATEIRLGGVATDAGGAIVLVGSVRLGWLDFGGGRETVDTVGAAPYVAKIDGAGKHVFTRLFRAGDASANAKGVAVASDGRIAFTGDVDGGGIDLGGGKIGQRLAPVPESAFVAVLDASGKHLSSRAFTPREILSSGGASGEAVALGPRGEVSIAGYFTGSTDFGGGAIESKRGRGFLVTLDTGSRTLWARALGGVDDVIEAHAVAMDGSGSVLAAGESYGQEYPRVVNPHSPEEATVVRPGGEGGKEIFLTKLAPAAP